MGEREREREINSTNFRENKGRNSANFALITFAQYYIATVPSACQLLWKRFTKEYIPSLTCESDRNSCPNNTPLFAFQPITTGDVHKIIKSLPSNKAPGCDKVNVKILKDSSPVIAPIITSLINNAFTLSTFPLPWKKGRKET